MLKEGEKARVNQEEKQYQYRKKENARVEARS
jgi:hypothetical protein